MLQRLDGVYVCERMKASLQCFLFRTRAERTEREVKYLDVRCDHWVLRRTLHASLRQWEAVAVYRRARGSWNCTPSFVAQQPRQVCHPEFSCRKSSCSPKHFVASLWYYEGKIMNRLRNEQWDFEESRAHQKNRSEPNKLTLAQLQTMFLHKRGIHNDKRCNTLEWREHDGWNQLEPHETGIKQDAQWAQTQRNRLKTSNASKQCESHTPGTRY